MIRWVRVRPGLYESEGEPSYQVGLLPSGEWYADGPGVDQAYATKGDAQQACQYAQEREKT